MKLLVSAIVITLTIVGFQNCSDMKSLTSEGSTLNSLEQASESLEIGAPISSAPCRDNLPKNQNIYPYENYGICADGAASIRIQLRLSNYTESQKDNLQVCFQANAAENCLTLSEFENQFDPNLYSIETYPKDLGVPAGQTTAYLKNAASGLSVTANYESVDEYFGVTLGFGTQGTLVNPGGVTTVNVADQMQVFISAKNATNDFSACAEIDGTNACVASAYLHKQQLLAPSLGIHRYSCSENTRIADCSRASASIRELGLEEGQTYNIYFKDESTRFPNLIVRFQVTVERH